MLKNPIMTPHKILNIKGTFQDLITGQQSVYYFETSDEINHANAALMDNPQKSYTVQSVRVPYGYENCEGWENLTLGAIHKRAMIHVNPFTSLKSFFLAIQQMDRSSLQVNWYRAYLFKNPVDQGSIGVDSKFYYNIQIALLNDFGDQMGIVYSIHYPKTEFEKKKWIEEQILDHFIDRFAQMYSPDLKEGQESKEDIKSTNDSKPKQCSCGHHHDKEKIKSDKKMVIKNYGLESYSDLSTH